MTLTCLSFDPDFVSHVRAGGGDANGQPAETAVSGGVATPCRCCLDHVPAGQPYLILSARPFPAPQPYAEQGPIFLCAGACAPWQSVGFPPVLRSSPQYLLKGYSADHRIVYGTGQIVGPAEIEPYALEVFVQAKVAYIDVRSARNNCFLTRIPRPDGRPD